MHEKGVVDHLIRKIIELAKRENARKVTKVSVILGALSHMSKEHFKEHFDVAALGSIAQGAEIEAEECQDIDDPNAMVVILKSIDVA